MTAHGELAPKPITVDHQAERREDAAAIHDACNHFKQWLQSRPYPDYDSTDHVLRHPLNPKLMTVGTRVPGAAAAFYDAVWRASMNSENMPHMTVVRLSAERDTADILTTLDELSPTDRPHRNQVVDEVRDIAANSQAAIFLPFTLDNTIDSGPDSLVADQTGLLLELRDTLQPDGLIVVVSRTADSWRTTAEHLGYQVLDATASKKDQRLMIITLQKRREQTTAQA